MSSANSTTSAQKRKRADGGHRSDKAGKPERKRLPKPKKRMRVVDYHSSSSSGSEDDEDEVDGAAMEFVGEEDDEEEDTEQAHSQGSPLDDAVDEEQEDEDSNEDSENDSNEDDETSDTASALTGANTTLKRRHNPDAFASSLAKILAAPLTTTQRANPVLARSTGAARAHAEIADQRLEGQVRRRAREERRVALDRGRERDVFGTEGGSDAGVGKAGEVAEQERRLKKTAQRGVVRLFNAVRAAQVRGLEAERAAKEQGLVGLERRREHVGEMSKKGFLDLLVGQGAGAPAEG